MNFYKDALEHISQHKWINSHIYGEEHERSVRRAISQSRKIGIILVPTTNHNYEDINTLSSDVVEKFMQEQISSIKTQYFNTIAPLRNRVKNDQLVQLMGQLELILVDNTQ